MDEIWKKIKSFSGYEASNLGNIRTNRPRNRNAKSCEYRNIKQSTLSKGHKRFQAYLGNGKFKNILVHRAVYEAFNGEIPTGKIICHNDGNPQNNNLYNLRCDTYSSNTIDSIKHGTHPFLRSDIQSSILKNRHLKTTHCKRGHENNAENTSFYKHLSGYNRRVCKICRKIKENEKKGEINER